MYIDTAHTDSSLEKLIQVEKGGVGARDTDRNLFVLGGWEAMADVVVLRPSVHVERTHEFSEDSGLALPDPLGCLADQ